MARIERALAGSQRLRHNPDMPNGRATFERVLKLSAFDGDSRAALRALHAHFSAELPHCTLALLLASGQPPGRCRLAGLIGPDATEHVPNVDPNGVRVTLPPFDDDLAARIVAGTGPQVLSVSPIDRGLPLAQALFAPAAVLAIPLANAGDLTHWVVFASSMSKRFSQLALEQLLLHVNLAASLIVRPIALRSLTKESRRQRREIESLADIQKLLLPDNPQIRGLEYAAHWQPAETAAGDYYEMSNLTEFAPEDFHPTGDDIWGVIVADVSGHGAAAAMEAAQFDAIMRTYRGDGPPPPAGAITYANRYFFSRRNRGHFMTVFAIIYRPDTRILSYLSAGHPGVFLRRGREVITLGEGDQIPLGVLRDYEYHNNEIRLEPGDLLVLYTDGLTEARNGHEQMFGIDRLRQLIAEGAASPSALCAEVITAVTEHQGSAIGADDQTLIVLSIPA